MKLWMPKTKSNYGPMYAILAGMNAILAAIVAINGNWFFAGYGLVQALVLGTWAAQSMQKRPK